MDKVSRAVVIAKLVMIMFGYLILGMFQHTLDPTEFHWVATIIFFIWFMIWAMAPVKRTDK